jgi:2,4-dienoyl-CoA reductase-like NADH-dependent reductase (Old Yellow Enzyme family)
MLIDMHACFFQDGQAWKGQLAIFDDSHIPGLSRLAKGLHEARPNTLAFVQLYHGGDCDSDFLATF